MAPKYKFVEDPKDQQSVAGRINAAMKLIDVPALRGNISYDQAINAWMTMFGDTEKGHFGESVAETARKRVAFWVQIRDTNRLRVSVLAAWLDGINPLILVSFLMAFWETDLKTTKGYAATMDIKWLGVPEGRVAAAKFIFDTLYAIQAQKKSGRG
jgi:hypothetical protein